MGSRVVYSHFHFQVLFFSMKFNFKSEVNNCPYGHCVLDEIDITAVSTYMCVRYGSVSEL